MNPKQKIQQDLKESLKSKDGERTSTMKMLLAAMENEEIKLGKKEQGLTEEEGRKIIKSEIKKRQDAMEAYEKAGRNELFEKEKKEFEILKKYLPEEMPRSEIEKLAKEAIAETGAADAGDFGKVMKETMARSKGRADGKTASEIIKDLLSS